MNGAVFVAVYLRDLRLAWRRRTEALLPVAFFLVAASLFPLGVGPDPQVLKLIAPGVVWVCALLAAMLSMPPLYAADHADGSLEQLLLAPDAGLAVAAAKAAGHWTISGAPLVVAAPLLGLLLGLPAEELPVLFVSLLLGTPILSLLGGVGAALTLGLRSAGRPSSNPSSGAATTSGAPLIVQWPAALAAATARPASGASSNCSSEPSAWSAA